ncbi:antirestriction protein ArdA [Corynebacterium comes]|uniref:Antirestriction protein (ArdA) n=1 Tax=Corynebacterium comes TaxID=2675218 RepID=A0A6B8VPW9_9CORY|nr:antirestriction protein ArdA [Corynebacterium comes]QGU05099.1 Antirestriction protein (ArdA) [Corynebacterium comes]
MTTTTHTTLNAPRIWLGCLQDYNAGRLVGAWYDAVDLYNDEDLGTTEDVHEQGGFPAGDYCEEIWGLDHENMPVRGEMGLDEARKWGERYEELNDDDNWLVFCAWVRDGNAPSVSEFSDRYQGQWDSFRDYVEDAEEACGTFDGWPELAVRFFDWDSYADEMEQSYNIIDAPQGVWVFSH